MLWTTNERSADYSFNKSHAACYALISYRTAWLKANYPAEYMAALISSVMDTKDKVPFFVAQAEQMGIEILPPDVNLSDHEFVVVDGNIRFGLDAVKGVGYAAVEAIKRARGERPRRRRPFTDLFDFCERVDNRAVNKKAIEALIKCGAFGSTGRRRKGMLAVLEQAQAAGPEGPAGRADRPGLDLRPRARRSAAATATRARRRAVAGPSHAPIPGEEFDRSELLAAEKESIGLFISAHPLKEVGAGAARQGRLHAGRARRPPRRRLGDGRRDDHPGQADQDQEGRLDDVRHARRPRGLGRDHRVRQGAGGAARTRSQPTRSCSSAASVDHKDRDKTCLIAQQVERFEPSEEEVPEAQAQAAKPAAAAERAAAAPRRDRAARDRARRAQGSARRLPRRVRRGDRAEHLGRQRRLKLGPSFRVTRTAGLHAELDALLGAR